MMLQWLGTRASQQLLRTRPNQILRRRFHDHYNAAKEEQSVRLSGGRTMGFAEYGDLNGTPAFLMHGSPGSRYDGFGFIDVAKKLNIRIICPDRPGFGLSSVDSSRKLSAYPKDIAELAKHLHISQYHVFGVSGGGPYTVASAHSSPSSELLSASVIAGMGPPGVLTVKHAGWYTVQALALMKYAPGIVRAMMNWSLASEDRLRRQLKFALRFLPAEDQEELSGAREQALTMSCLKSAYVQGSAGTIRDGQMYLSGWDFELKDVRKCVKLFFGGRDTRTPLAFGRYYKHHLPKAELFEFECAGHATISKFDEEVLGYAIGDGREPKSASRVYR